MINKLKQITPFEILFVTVLIFIVGFAGYVTYGHLTQKETITIGVVNKDTHTTTTQNCNTIDDMTVCTPITTTSYRVIVADGERFDISKSLYDNVIVGKKHVFYVTGWVGMRRIRRILE